MNIIKKIFLLVLLLFLFNCKISKLNLIDKQKASQKNTITIGSFNLKIFGEKKVKQINTLTILAKIATNFDILAVQEVGSNDSASTDKTCKEIMNAYINKINEISNGKNYTYINGNQYAIIYNVSKVKKVVFNLYSGSQSFTYIPLIVNFKVLNGNFDFSMICIHTRPNLATQEIPNLKKVIDEVKIIYNDPDVICLGDYNADGTYYKKGTGEALNGFPESEYITVIPNSADTSVSSKSLAYDRIELTKSMTEDYATKWGVIKYDQVYDVSNCESQVSDHYPVWAMFYTNNDSE